MKTKQPHWRFTKPRQRSLIKARKVHSALVRAGKRVLSRKHGKYNIDND